ncbi:TRAP transporter small permease [Petroclostridium sp. X23]|uniref:TRAP transporter small permease n=1 Tax=Petroclostridium sp. X23 TaxID=3045146 RepID=UPI0024ADBA1B|nr:TRAP transporter small permease [Petroclostridium sp. X23]WHH58225.1 TRAP transporter small permease [Petroclostridium sp. X23]
MRNNSLRWSAVAIKNLIRVIITILSILIPTLIFLQVLLRYVFNAPLMGIEELITFPTIWLYFLGGAYASNARSHIECGMLKLYIKRPVSTSIFNILKSIISLIISGWLTYWAGWYFAYSYKIWKLSDILYIPLFFAESAIFIGLVLMTIYTVSELIDHIKDYSGLKLKNAEEE